MSDYHETPATKYDILADVEAERSVIGACLISDRACQDACQLLDPADFALQIHRELFRVISEQAKTGRVDEVTVASELASLNIAETLRAMVNETPSVSNVGQYARAIVDWRIRRDLLWASEQISGLVHDTRNTGDLIDEAKRRIERIDESSTGNPTPDPTVDEFIANTPTEYDWLIPDFLERRDRMLVTAGEGVGKSVLIAQIGVMAAAGVHPWTLQPIEPCNVAIIDLENGPRLLARRLGNLRRNAPNLEPGRLRIHADPRGINLTSRADKRWLMDRCTANKTDLLVIGPAYRMAAGVATKGDIGGEDQIREVTKALDDIRNRCDVTLLLETHAPHSRDGMTRDLRPFGSSVWLRWPEFGIGIRKDGPNDDPTKEYVIQHWRGPRDERTWPKGLMRDGRTWPWMPFGMPNGTFTNRSTAA